MNEGLIIVVLGIVLVAMSWQLWQARRRTASRPDELLDYLREAMAAVRQTTARQDEMSRFIAQNLTNQSRDFHSVLQKNSQDLNARLDRSMEVVAKVQKSLGEMGEIGRAMQELQDYLKNPKLRGNIGEAVLSQVLAQMLPAKMYALQYAFKTGDKVDAVIKLQKHFLPVDAKFPMTNYRKLQQATDQAKRKAASRDFVRDVKKHLKAISQKYILEDEQTTDYALMYIPSEAVYYEVIKNPDLFEYANQMRVLSVSPMSFYAYLKAIIMSFQGLTIQKKAQEILKVLQALRGDYGKLQGALVILEKHFGNAYNQLQNVGKQMTFLGQRLESTQMLKSGEVSLDS